LDRGGRVGGQAGRRGGVGRGPGAGGGRAGGGVAGDGGGGRGTGVRRGGPGGGGHDTGRDLGGAAVVILGRRAAHGQDEGAGDGEEGCDAHAGFDPTDGPAVRPGAPHPAW